MDELPSSDKEHADAEWLTRDGAEAPGPPVAPDQQAVSPDAYEVQGVEPGDLGDEPVLRVVPPVPESPPRPKASEKPTTRTAAESAVVDVVWTRWREWGPDLPRLGLAALATLFLLYIALSYMMFMFAFIVLAAGTVVMAVLSYPLAITLERPVRVTPEQAVKDYYGALSHSMPHFRRMWLLLSSAGRSCPEFASFEAFESYWRARLFSLGDGVPRKLNPLLFDVDDFRSEKSSGQTSIDGTFTLNVRDRHRPDRPVRAFKIELGLVRGPDRMWYLNRGTIPKD
jgi:hypothetical protein